MGNISPYILHLKKKRQSGFGILRKMYNFAYSSPNNIVYYHHCLLNYTVSSCLLEYFVSKTPMGSMRTDTLSACSIGSIVLALVKICGMSDELLDYRLFIFSVHSPHAFCIF